MYLIDDGLSELAARRQAAHEPFDRGEVDGYVDDAAGARLEEETQRVQEMILRVALALDVGVQCRLANHLTCFKSSMKAVNECGGLGPIGPPVTGVTDI